MENKLFYCGLWFRAKKRPADIWTEEQAKAAHLNKKHYVVLVGSIDRPSCFIDVAGKVVGVGFLDELLREKLTYAFQEVEPGKLFLTMATHREYKKGTDVVFSGISYLFKTNGEVNIRRENFDPYQLETATTLMDVSTNYSVYPDFGEYEDLIRVERG